MNHHRGRIRMRAKRNEQGITLSRKLHKKFLCVLSLIFFLATSGTSSFADSSVRPPLRIDFEGFHTEEVRPQAVPYSPGPPLRIDFEGFHTEEVRPQATPYSPSPPVRVDFEGFRATE